MSEPGVAADEAAARKLTWDEVPRAVDLLSRAAEDDPLVRWAVRLEAGRRLLFDACLRQLTMPHGEVWTIDDVAGVALWVPPARVDLRPLDLLVLVWPGLRAVGPLRAPGVLAGFLAFQRRHPRAPHFYLAFIGVDPAQRGRALAPRLLAPVLERCDREKIPAYTAATSERTRTLLERNGFVLVESFDVPHGGPRLWLMWREPH